MKGRERGRQREEDRETTETDRAWERKSLFYQAICLHPMLIAKVLDWARASGGLFPVANQPGKYSRPEELGPETMSKIKWARIKALPRTLEKLQRTYREVNLSPHTHLTPPSLTSKASSLLYR